MTEYINIKHWYDMYSKISERILAIAGELANYDETTPTNEYCTKKRRVNCSKCGETCFFRCRCATRRCCASCTRLLDWRRG